MSFRLFLLGFLCLLSSGCVSLSPEQQAQRDRIAQEPRGDYWIGRRFHWMGTRVWGYVRRPGKSWDSARLVVMDESRRRQPDRFPESASAGISHGFDHNFEYRLWGDYIQEVAYDPNSNLELPLFRLQRYELVSRAPGFLFRPRDTHDQKRIPRRF